MSASSSIDRFGRGNRIRTPPPAGRLLDPYVTAHGLDQPLDDRQPETEAVSAHRVEPLESVEDLRAILRCHPSTGVEDGEPDVAGVSGDLDPHGRPAVLERVVDQVVEDPPQVLPVADGDGRLRGVDLEVAIEDAVVDLGRRA